MSLIENFLGGGSVIGICVVNDWDCLWFGLVAWLLKFWPLHWFGHLCLGCLGPGIGFAQGSMVGVVWGQ